MASDSENKAIADDHTKFEPGAAPYGNFINYYSFNSVIGRLLLLPTDLSSVIKLEQEPIVCLDIGCNSGDLTTELYSYLVSSYTNKQIFMLGIDIDDILITRCNESNKYSANITYKQIDIMGENALHHLKSYLQLHNKSEFDIITCFSTTMWIHLNNGDDGLNSFLEFISNLTKNLIIEPQEWKCYKSAFRRINRLKKEKLQISSLEIREISVHLILFLSEECNMMLKQCFGETSWDRKLLWFQKH